MKRWLPILVLLLSGAAFGSNFVYISHAGAGTQDGSSCSNAKPYSYFNSSGNWNSSPTGIQIGPGTTVHGCAETYYDTTAGDTALTFQCGTATGTSGNPITLIFDQGQTNLFNSNYWNGSNGAITNSGSCSYVVINGDNNLNVGNLRSSTVTVSSGTSVTQTGGATFVTITPAGATGAYVFINGTWLQVSSWNSSTSMTLASATTNGSGQTMYIPSNGTGQANSQTSNAAVCNGCTNTTIENLTSRDIYVNNGSSSGSTDIAGQYCSCITLNGTSTGSTVSGNTLSECRTGIVVSADTNSDISNTTISNNAISDNDWMVEAASGDSGATGTNITIANNTATNWTNWNYPTASYHQDGFILFNFGNPNTTFTYVVNGNHIYGELGEGAATGFLFCEVGASCEVFNNLFVHTGTAVGQPGMMWFGASGLQNFSGPHQVYNNTIVASAATSDVCINMSTTTWAHEAVPLGFAITDSNGRRENVTTAGTTGGTQPAWPTSSGVTTNDGSAVWTSSTKQQSVIQNNIALNCHIGYSDYNSGNETSTINYNVWGGAPQMATEDGANFYSFSQWQTDTGFDANSTTTDPSLNGSYFISSTSSSAYNEGITWSGAPGAWGTGAPASFGPGGSCGAGCIARHVSGSQDAGAYPFSSGSSPAATPTLSPVAGTYTGAQTVTISTSSSGAIICYNTTGSPATNGTTGCTTGTLYSSPVSVAVSETLYAVAGGTGYTDSSVGSAAYIINYTVTVTVSGVGGSVSSSPTGINACNSVGSPCSAPFASGSSPVLTATANAGYIFAGWSICGGLYSAGSPITCTLPALTGNLSVGAVFIAMNPALPQTWVNNNEGNTAWSYEYQLGQSSWITGPPAGCTFSIPYATTASGLQSAVNAMEACRTLTGVGIALDIPPGLYTTSSSNGLVIPQTNSATASQFIVLRSTQDLPNGTIVCSHGMQDNLSTSSDIGIRNPDCTGANLSYQLGTTITTIPAGAFTLANGQATNTAAYDDVASMYTLESSGANPSALTFCNASGTSFAPTCGTNIAPDHWLIEDMEARPQAGNTGTAYIVTMADQATTVSQKATHIHFRKDWVHADWCDNCLTTGANSISGAFQLDGCIYCSVVDTQTSELLRPGAECNAINANGTTYKINHNWIEGCGPGIFAGGYGTSGPVLAGWLPYQNVEVRRNRLTYPYVWLGQSPIPACPTVGCNSNWPASFALYRKNAYENKESAFTLVDGNILENVDNSGAQNGVAFDFNAWNSSSGTPGPNYQSQITDVTFLNNITRNTCDVWESDGLGGLSGGVTLPAQRFLFANNLHYNASTTNPGCSTATNVGLSWESSLHRWQGSITESQAGEATLTATCSVDLGGCIGQIGSVTFSGSGSCTNGTHALTFSGGTQISGGVLPAATYTCAGSVVTAATVTTFGSGYTVAPVVSGGPTGYTFAAVRNTSSSAPGTGAAQFDLLPGQPLTISQCNGTTAFNSPTITKGGFLFPSGIGPTAAQGTVPTSLTVSYPWSGVTSGTTDSNGYCMISVFQAMPAQLQFTHNTVVTDSTHTLTSANTQTQSAGPNYQQNAFLQNDIMLGGGWFNNPLGEGCVTTNWNFDPNSLTNDHLVWPTRTSTLYTSCLYGANPAYPIASPVATFPATPYCTGSTTTAYTGPGTGCMGFVGAMSTSSMPLTLADYHNYELRSDSSFYAGGSADASDGTDQGANIPALDTAQVLNQYVCSGPCGTPGPFPDLISSSNVDVQIFGPVTIKGKVKIF